MSQVMIEQNKKTQSNDDCIRDNNKQTPFIRTSPKMLQREVTGLVFEIRHIDVPCVFGRSSSIKGVTFRSGKRIQFNKAKSIR